MCLLLLGVLNKMCGFNRLTILIVIRLKLYFILNGPIVVREEQCSLFPREVFKERRSGLRHFGNRFHSEYSSFKLGDR